MSAGSAWCMMSFAGEESSCLLGQFVLEQFMSPNHQRYSSDQECFQLQRLTVSQRRDRNIRIVLTFNKAIPSQKQLPPQSTNRRNQKSRSGRDKVFYSNMVESSGTLPATINIILMLVLYCRVSNIFRCMTTTYVIMLPASVNIYYTLERFSNLYD